MAIEPESAPAVEPDLPTLLRDLVHNSEQLIQLQLSLAREEVGQELLKARAAALELGAGAGLLAASGALTTAALVHLLRRVTGLPLWACYGLLAGSLGTLGYRLLASSRAQAADIQLPALPQTTAALKENLTWLKEQVTTPRTQRPT